MSVTPPKITDEQRAFLSQGEEYVYDEANRAMTDTLGGMSLITPIPGEVVILDAARLVKSGGKEYGVSILRPIYRITEMGKLALTFEHK